MTAALLALLAAVPALSRDDARDAARRELSKPVYDAAEPSLGYRILRAVGRAVMRVLDAADDASPGGIAGLLGILAVVAAVAIVVFAKVGPLRRSAAVFSGGVFDGPLTAAEHRQRAEQAAAAGDWAEAVRERLRAIVRELETRGVLEPRLGRTADEVAREAGDALPDHAAALAAAATTFDEIWYGRRPATAVDERQLTALDDALRRARLAVAAPA